jgi:predicted type IV restriction endonuclease
MAIPAKVAARLTAGLKKFQPILAAARARDVNESDTVVILTDMLSEVFGYEKYMEITSEYSIRGTYCDLAVKLDGALQFLVEAKAVGTELKDAHVKQAVDYAANQGCDWVVLSNGITWRVYKIVFAKPIDQELVVEINLTNLNAKKDDDLDLLWLLAKEGWQKARLGEYHTQKQALSRYSVGALLLTETLIDVIRRELRRVTPGVRIESEDIRNVLEHEVIKRDVLEGEKAADAKKLITRAATRALRKSKDDTPAEVMKLPDPDFDPSPTGSSTPA